MSQTVIKLVRAGFTEQQAAALEELFPEVLQESSDTTYRLPVEVIESSTIPAACTITGVDEILATVTIPKGILGPNSIIKIEPVWSFTSSANNKIVKVKVGPTILYSATRTTSEKEGPMLLLGNRNSYASQVQPYDTNYATASAGQPNGYMIDTSKPLTIQITGQRADGSDTLTLEYYLITHFGGL